MTQKPTFLSFMRLFNSSTFIGLVMLFGSVAGHGQTFPGNDDTPGTKTFTVPEGVTSITATAWGGGGGGGWSNEWYKGGNGGGGGGATTMTIPVLGNTFTYSVGAKGNGGNGENGGNGGNGEESVIRYNATPSVIIKAYGGTGGLPNRKEISNTGTSNGGSATGVDFKKGQNGDPGASGLFGNKSGKGGDSGEIRGIKGSGGAAVSNSAGLNGNVPGGGGSGGDYKLVGGAQNGGNGANGRVSFQFIQVTDAVISTNCAVNTITIDGNYFAATGDTSVTINGVNCTVTSVTSTQIIATLPANATSGQVVVTNANRTNNGKTVTVNPASIALSLSASNATVCKNSIQPIVATATAGSTVTWLPISNLYTNAACTTPYVANTHASTVWAKPSVTTTYTATATSGACTKTAAVTYTVENAIWNGSAWSTDPTGIKSIEFAGDYSKVENIDGCDCTVTSGNVVIATGKVLKLQNELNVIGGTMTFENNASLIQTNNVTNRGEITYKRTATGIKGFDFVYWSSPVKNQTLETLYNVPGPASGPKYFWNPTVNNGNGGEGNWQGAGGVMQAGKGYIIRGSSSYGMPATDIKTAFIGTPNNGDVSIGIARGTYTGDPKPGFNGVQITNLNDNYNLIGNPYPSAIGVADFLNANQGAIHGNVKLWRHGSAPAAIENPFYGSYTYNYNTNDYVTINLLGASEPGLEPIIKTGQAFLVQMEDGPAGTGTVSFNNTMRLKGNDVLDNGSFFRPSPTANNAIATNETGEKHRIWLDLMDQNNIVSGTLIGYTTGATDAFDSAFDARSAVPNFMKIYTLLNNEVYDIQGKSLPFNTNDQVPLGITTVQAGNYKIALNTIDGLFSEASQAIYLEDKTTNVIHDLKTSPYSFTTTAGTFHDRFVLRYTNQTLGLEDFTSNDIKVYANESITVMAGNQTIKTVRVYDLLGRVLGNFTHVNNSTFNTTSIAKTQTALLVEVQLENGVAKTYKVIF